jgi:hypothetical protein
MFGMGSVPRWQPAPAGTAHAVGSSPLLDGVERVSAGTQGSIATPGSARVILAAADHRLFAVTGNAVPTGGPQSVLLASSTFMTNAALDRDDNAALALNLAGPPSRAVLFDEYDHGYGRTGTGLAGLPVFWRWGLALALAAIIVWMLSAARRFGPVQRPDRVMIPARVEYADAMATALATLPADRLGETVAPLRAEARRLLCRRAGVWTSADDAEVLAAARAARVPEHVTAPILEPGVPGPDPDPISIGTALAWLESTTGSRT